MIEQVEVEVKGGKIYHKGHKKPLTPMNENDVKNFLKSKNGKRLMKLKEV